MAVVTASPVGTQDPTPVGFASSRRLTLGRPRAVGVALGVAIATMPILVPSGLGNSAPADVPIAVACGVAVFWLRRSRARVRVPYLVPVTLSMLAGLVATYFSGADTTVLAVLQDGFCLLWAVCVANAVRLDPRLLRVVVVTWVRSGIVWAVLLCIGRLASIDWLAGITARDGTRAAFTLGDPNLAGNYFVCCFAMLLATSAVRHRWARIAGGAVILLAIVFTGSNGAAIGLIIVVAVGLLGTIRRRLGATAMIAVLALGGAAAVVVAPMISLSQIQQQAADSIPILHDSLGRADESSGTREVLVQEAVDLYLHRDLIGIGPTRTKETLQADAAPYVKEAHDDYTATIVERGLAGGVALVLLIWVVGTRFTRIVSRRPRPEVSQLVPRPEYLLGLVIAFAVAGFFYEVLHFRHLWALLGLGAGIEPAAGAVRSR